MGRGLVMQDGKRDGTDGRRRAVLRGIVLLAAAGAATARPAAAMRPLAVEDYRAVLDEGCGATAYHRRQFDEAAARLGVALSAEQRAAILARQLCPTCGCLLAEALAMPAPALPF
ncbi:hypothetical protein [Azospirillum sp. ST 5-10]|uniref:hypothetical protein n=1 Tax=unclassified Azospirillum TaxID=2630922 RepID=UPI003F4A55B0